MTLNIRGRLLATDRALVMGILNLTPDSFYAGSRLSLEGLLTRVEAMLRDGADIIDLGACSTRPGAAASTAEQELEMLVPAVKLLRSETEAVISVDTFRADVARACVEAGADMINDVGGGRLDEDMFETVAELKVPYVLMHSRGDSQTMQSLTDYEDVAADVLRDLAFKADRLHQLGVCDVIIDPGFGFAKTIDQNYRLLAYLQAFKAIGCPVLAGLSRKSMVYRELGLPGAEAALNGTTALNMLALVNGADILRVHDVREARETVSLFEAYKRNLPKRHSITTRDACDDNAYKTVLI